MNWQEIWESASQKESRKSKMDVESTRNARQKGVVAFTRFCQDKKGHEECLFCFFEGEDSKYYGSRIEQYTEYPSEKVINYNCGGRKEVERVYLLISKRPEYDDVNKMFFIDSDYIPNEQVPSDMYQTPCYSIENFYSSADCFGKILNREFGINSIDSDYSKCVTDYCNRQREFHSHTGFLNVWLSCQREEEEIKQQKAVVLRDFKVAQLFSEISIAKVECKQVIDKNLLMSIFPDAYDIEQTRIDATSEVLSARKVQQVYRGKFEFEFLRKILESIIIANKARTYFSEVYNCVHLTPGSNMLSSLSMYADTPTCLISFLKAHKCTSS